MSPYTKDRVKWARIAQLTLRVLTLLGALGSLFCSIVITGAAATVIWIIRVGVRISYLIGSSSADLDISQLSLSFTPFMVFVTMLALLSPDPPVHKPHMGCLLRPWTWDSLHSTCLPHT